MHARAQEWPARILTGTAQLHKHGAAKFFQTIG